MTFPIRLYCPQRMMVKKSIYISLISILCLTFFVFRLYSLDMSEPRTDQATFARWLQDLVGADHVLPHRLAEESWRSSLEGDQRSVVHNLMIRIYNTPHISFNLVPLTIFYFISLFTGDSYRAQVGMSIFASICVLLVLGLLPYWITKPHDKRQPVLLGDAVAGAVALLIAGTTLYLHLYSAWGVHNLGVLFLLAAVAVTILSLDSNNESSTGLVKLRLLPIVIASVLAVYAHWTNVFVLLPANVVAFISNTNLSRTQRVRLSVRYITIIGLFISPVILLMFAVRPNPSSSGVVYAAFEDKGIYGFLADTISRAGKWFAAGAMLFSAAGVVVGLAGLVLLAWIRKVGMPLWVVTIHFLVWCIIPGFTWNGSPTWLRTFLYVLPFFCLGAGYCLALPLCGEFPFSSKTPSGMALKWKALLIPATLLILHLTTQFPGFVEQRKVEARIPEFSLFYLKGQGNLRPLVNEINGMLPNSSTLLVWDSSLQNVYACFKDKAKTQVLFPPALKDIWVHYKDGSFEAYVRRRRITIDHKHPVFLVADKLTSQEELQHAVSDVFGPEGLNVADSMRLSVMETWETGVYDYGDVTLYAVSY
jgi:hypothetical protein